MRKFRERLTGPFAGDAYRFALLPLLAAVACAAAGTHYGALFFLLCAAACLAFFRNPARRHNAQPRDVLAPADGRVLCADVVEGAAGARVCRIGIFLSVLDVHINRAPVAGRVLSIARSGEKFLAAFNPDAARRNVQLTLALETADGQRVDVVQITGLIARRIVCHAEAGEHLARGVRYGLIRFGSRTDVLLPAASALQVKVGDRVRGGQTVIATLPAAAADASPATPTPNTNAEAAT